MSSMSRVDPGTLGWVKNEIDETLKQARLALDSFAENAGDTTRLRFCITHLHQVVGTLQMVELAGAAMLARETEALAEAILNGRTPASEPVFMLLRRAIITLSEYLEQLRQGRPDVPLRLAGLINELRGSRHEEPIAEVALFEPDLSVYPPRRKDLPEKPSEEDYRAGARRRRALYQAALLRWLRDNADRAALDELAQIVTQLEQGARFGAAGQLWWVAAGFIETLAEQGPAATPAAKKLLGQIEQQIKRLADHGEASLIRDPADDLVKALLFHVAGTARGGARVAELKAAFELDTLIGAAHAPIEVSAALQPDPDAVRPLAADLAREIESAQELLAAYFDPAQAGARSLDTLRACLDGLGAMLAPPGVAPLKALVDEIAGVARVLAQGEIADSEAASLQMAGALLLLENNVREIEHPGVDWKRQIDSSIAALRTLRAGGATLGGAPVEGIEISEAALTDIEFKQLLGVVAGEIHVNLKKVEDALEVFAGDRLQIAPLQDVPKHLNQIQGALQILGQERAAELTGVANQYVQDILAHRLVVDNAVLDALAVAVGAIEAYVEGLRYDRPRLDALIDTALHDMDAAITGRRVVGADPLQLAQDIRAKLEAWLHTTDDQKLLLALKQRLREISALATQQGQPRLQKIAGELGNLLDIVAQDAAFMSADTIDTLWRSLDTLTALARRQRDGEAAEVDRADGIPTLLDARAPVESITLESGELEEEILQTFVQEADEVLTAIASRLGEWRAHPDNQTALTDLRRSFHTLKGSGKLAGATAVSEFAWVVENLLNKVIKGAVDRSPALFDFLARAREALAGMVAELTGGPAAGVDLGAWRAEADVLMARRDQAVPGGAAAGAAPARVELDPAVLQIFTKEARNHLATIAQEVIRCEEAGAPRTVSWELFRSAHTLLGNARSLGLQPMSQMCEQLEGRLQLAREHGLPLDAQGLALLRRAGDAVAELLDDLNAGRVVSEALAARFGELATAFAAQIKLAVPPSPPAMSESEMDAAAQEPELREIFYEEAIDILGAIGAALTRWRAQPLETAAAGELKRALHTLKGSARMAGMRAIGELAHSTETLLTKIERGATPAGERLFDLIEEVDDTLVTMVEKMQAGQVLPDVAELNARLLRWPEAPVPDAPPVAVPVAVPEPPRAPDRPASPAIAAPPAAPAPPSAEIVEFDRRAVEPADDETMPAPSERRGQVRVRTDLLNNLANYAGEVSITRARMQQQIHGFRDNLKELRGNVTRFREQIRELEIQAESQILARPELDRSALEQDFDPLEFDRFSRLQHLSRSLSESLNDLVTIQSGLDGFVGDAETVLQQQARLNTELQEGLMRTRMIGFSTQIPRLRHIVRQTARELGKQAELVVAGAEVEIDRNVLERMIGPFEHMIRNAIDHGIEGSAERARAGKPENGRIAIQCRQEGNEIVLRFEDDGRGLDLARIRRRASELGMLKDGSALTDAELTQIIFLPGFSTAERVTHLSGRGVGMDVVHSEVKQLGGGIAVESEIGKGTAFTIRLPLTLSIAQALIVRAGEQPFAIPLASIANVLTVRAEQLRTARRGDKPVFRHRERDYPLMQLGKRLGLPGSLEVRDKVPLLLARAGAQEIAVQVDHLLNTQEIVVKPVGPQIAELYGVAGATILGDGGVVLILDLGELWLTQEATQAGVAPVAAAVNTARTPLVLVVDDSLTVRKVTNRHLRKHGLEVLMAKDGVDALEQMRDARPDLMLVDIEMPRMDGYELTTRIREDTRYRHIPIIIITSRAGEKHRQKAMELGADLYMTKPYQEDELMRNVEALLARSRLH